MSETIHRAHYQSGVPATIPHVTEPLPTIFWRTAADYPDRVAIDFLGATFTYGDLALATRRAAAALYRCGVRKGDVVALAMPNCPQHVIAFYAVLTLGAIVSEHNPLAPASEIHAQMERNDVRVVVAWEQTIEKLTKDGNFRGRTYVSVDLSRELPLFSRMLLSLPVSSARAQRSKLRGKVPVGVMSFDRIVRHAPSLSPTQMSKPSVDDTAVLIHTGGTTGVPKAVMLSHKNIVSNVLQTSEWIHGSKRGGEVVAAVLPLFHAFGLVCILGVAIYKAATLVMLPRFDVPALLAAQKRYPITLFPGVAPMFERILNAVDKDREKGKTHDLTSIYWAFSGAMALDPELAKRWEKETTGLIIEGYGMSEASPIIAGSPCTDERRPSTLGIPFPSTDIRIADPEDLSRDAEGVGEILARGPQIFQGYWKNPEETKNVMFHEWLRTGDLGYWDDGFLVMASRQKEMIINGGFNIYPAQVEDAIKGMPGVRDVAVVGMPDEDRGESVVAVLVLEPGSGIDLDAVRRWTSDKISHYAMPRSIAIRDDLPRSQLGKVVRRAVREELSGYELIQGEWKKKAAEHVAQMAESVANAANTLQKRLEPHLSSSQEEKNAEEKESTLPTEPSPEENGNHNEPTENS